MFWWGYLWNIWFSEPIFMKYENQLLMWKVICFSCTLSWLHILCRDWPFGYPGRQHLQAMSARTKTELIENSKIKIWASHKNTLADGSFFSLSFDTHSSHLSSLRHRAEAENRVKFSKISLILVQKPLIPFVSS